MSILDRINKNPNQKQRHSQLHIPDHSSHKTIARKLEGIYHISKKQAIGKLE